MNANPDLKQLVGAFELPGIGLPLADVGRVVTADASDGSLHVVIELGFPSATISDALKGAVTQYLQDASGIETVTVELESRVLARGVQANLKPLPGVRNVIAVASGKGGVGKSTLAVNLALALSADGGRVGILDADIYGPSLPLMLGLTGQRPVSDDGKTMQPLAAHGLQAMSIGFLVDSEQPAAWRGPMVTSALQQLLQQTAWDDLDYLVVDMPPGTGDIQLTLSQRVPLSGAVIVTTPQNIALADARKGLQMFRKVSVPVLGLVENMSYYQCPSCGHEASVFGAGGGQRMAADYDVPLLGAIPLDASIREQTDDGRPTVVAVPDSAQAQAFFEAARRAAARLATRSRDYSARFPRIVVEDS